MASDIKYTMPILFNELGDTDFERYELRAELRRRLSASTITTAKSHEALVRATRLQFEDVPGKPDATLDEFCMAVSERLGIDSDNNTLPLHARFVLNVLGFETLPFGERETLLEQTLKHLRHIEAQIAFYEDRLSIKGPHASSRVTGDPLLVDFYDRCRAERDAITRYLVSGLDDEAMRLADEDNSISRLLGIFRNMREAPPYRLRMPRGEEYLDHQQINTWWHRVLFLPVAQAHQLGEIYASDRDAFYRELLVQRPIVHLFKSLHDAAGQIERLRGRAQIFKELETLYNDKRWYGLYALALPQVEGLFTEMGVLAAPSGASGRSLPKKVRFIREYAAAHEQNLDYFEYILPRERNAFAHTGKVDDPEQRCIEILHDLAYACQVYTEIDIPIVELSKLLSTPAELREIWQWTRVFNLYKKVQEKDQQAEIGTKLADALAVLLPNDREKDAFVTILADRLRTDVAATTDRLKKASVDRLGIVVDLSARKTQEAYTRSADIAELIEELDAISSGAFLRPFDVQTIAKGVQEHVSMSDATRSNLEKVLTDIAKPLSILQSFLKER